MDCIDKSQDRYPRQLRSAESPPQRIWIEGCWDLLDKPAIAIVGSRQCTAYGARQATAIASGLARAGFVVVSGLAYGIDSHAHRAALEAGGRCIAVLAGGLDVGLPDWQQTLADEILERGGCLLSEHPPGTPALKHHFLLRNRIIAGLSLGTVVVEAADKSGALVTANYALEANRTVFAVPGDVDRATSVGTNRLLSQGAVVTRDTQDVLAAILPQLPESVRTSLGARPSVQTALASTKRASAEILAARLNVATGQVLQELAELEIAGRVVRAKDGSYSLKK